MASPLSEEQSEPELEPEPEPPAVVEVVAAVDVDEVERVVGVGWAVKAGCSPTIEVGLISDSEVLVSIEFEVVVEDVAAAEVVCSTELVCSLEKDDAEIGCEIVDSSALTVKELLELELVELVKLVELVELVKLVELVEPAELELKEFEGVASDKPDPE